jgi:hypothetical protein
MGNATRTAIRGEPLTGRARPDPVAINLRTLATQLLLQAVRDARCGETPWVRDEALQWLNSPEARAIARAFNLRWGRNNQPLTAADLPTRVRGTYFHGGR